MLDRKADILQNIGRTLFIRKGDMVKADISENRRKLGSTFTIKMLPIPLNFRGPGAIFKKNATVLFSVDGEEGGT